MKNDLLNELFSTKTALLEVLDRFSDHNFNSVPAIGGWTGGQVAEHVLLSVSGVADALDGPVKLADRDPEQHVKLLGDIFLNFGMKMKSPDFILPSDTPKDKKALIHLLGEAFDRILRVAGSSDLDVICTTFEMPTLGMLSRKEFIWFTVVHTKRHVHQLHNIIDYLKIKYGPDAQ